MPCPHNEISIVQRSHRQSAVAAAAYQSGEKLFCEYDQKVKHYPEKRGIVHNEILLPANAPLEYTDRNTLWNAAEAVEKQWNSQLARRWVLTIPREIPPDQYAVLVREFCQQQFVSKGMIVDFAIHDPHPPGHNPHAQALQRQVSSSPETGSAATDRFVSGIMDALNRYTADLAKEQIRLAFAQAQKEVDDLHQRTREGILTARLNGKQIGQTPGRKLTIKKSAPCKEQIKKYSRDFDGTLTDADCIKLIGIARNTYYKYKRELREEFTRNMES